jgi:hypothetical protein
MHSLDLGILNNPSFLAVSNNFVEDTNAISVSRTLHLNSVIILG